MNLVILQIMILIGLLLSVYALYVERHEKRNYKPICDINDEFSCSKAFKSSYGKTFGIPNSFSGIIFFAFVFILLIYNLIDFVFYISVIALAFGTYLIYILQFKLKIICLVCYGIYLINLSVLIFSYLLL